MICEADFFPGRRRWDGRLNFNSENFIRESGRGDLSIGQIVKHLYEHNILGLPEIELDRRLVKCNQVIYLEFFISH
jgi:hypothetical protein